MQPISGDMLTTSKICVTVVKCEWALSSVTYSVACLHAWMRAPSVKFPSFSCSFRQNLAKKLGWCPFCDWRPPSEKHWIRRCYLLFQASVKLKLVYAVSHIGVNPLTELFEYMALQMETVNIYAVIRYTLVLISNDQRNILLSISVNEPLLVLLDVSAAVIGILPRILLTVNLIGKREENLHHLKR